MGQGTTAKGREGIGMPEYGEERKAMMVRLLKTKYAESDVTGGLALHLNIGQIELAAGVVRPRIDRLFFINRWRDNSRQVILGPFIVGYYKHK